MIDSHKDSQREGEIGWRKESVRGIGGGMGGTFVELDGTCLHFHEVSARYRNASSATYKAYRPTYKAGTPAHALAYTTCI